MGLIYHLSLSNFFLEVGLYIWIIHEKNVLICMCLSDHPVRSVRFSEIFIALFLKKKNVHEGIDRVLQEEPLYFQNVLLEDIFLQCVF